jgi:hypothetical protein
MAILAGTLLVLYAANSLSPALGAALKAGAGAEKRSHGLWRRLLWLNALVLAIGTGLICAAANRPAPRTSGIRELNPTERARAESELERQRVYDRLREQVGKRSPDLPVGNGGDAASPPGTGRAAGP